MSVTPDVSIVLPVHNADATLSEALHSLRAQSHTNWELCVHDDGSTDGSATQLRSAAASDPRVRISTGSHQGIVAALNTAASHARAPWLVRMDADDVSAPNRIERLLEAADERPEVTFWASRIAYFPRDSLSDGMQRYETWINRVMSHDDISHDRFVECAMPHPAWMLHRSLFDALDGYRDGDFPEDYDFFLRSAETAAQFGKVSEVLLQWRDHPNRMSRTNTRYSLERFRACKADALIPMLGGRPVAIWGAARDGKRWARLLLERGVPVRAFYDDHTGRIGQQIEGIPVLASDAVPAPGDVVVLSTIGRNRATARDALRALGHRELETFFCVQ